jgi:Tfp pilus assembly protein PilE
MRRILIAAAAAVGVAGIAAIAYFQVPAYKERARDEQLAEAFRNLSDIHAWMDGYHQHYKTYANRDACAAAAVPAERARHFDYACVLDTAAGAGPGQSYTAIATGKSPGTAGFKFTIDQNKNKATATVARDWGALPANAGSVWLGRKP